MMEPYQKGLMQAFARAAARPEGTSGNDFLEAILRERDDLREKINSGELTAYVPEHGNGAHTLIIGDEIFKAPRVLDIFNSFDKEVALLKKMGKNGLAVPEVICTGEQSVFVGMKLVPGVELDSVLDTMTREELAVLSTDIVNFIIGMANSDPNENGFPHHMDLHERNVIVDPQTKKLMAVIDFGDVKHEPKLVLGQTLLAKGRILPGSPEKSLIQMIREEYALRKDEISDPVSTDKPQMQHKPSMHSVKARL